ncbi:hypothetical protein HK102_013137 [Quaeritorhiza haematococci]|nr:hypothetical protein HK102_013137 [Quaeritorhiza haematococci]
MAAFRRQPGEERREDADADEEDEDFDFNKYDESMYRKACRSFLKGIFSRHFNCSSPEHLKEILSHFDIRVKKARYDDMDEVTYVSCTTTITSLLPNRKSESLTLNFEHVHRVGYRDLDHSTDLTSHSNSLYD